MTAPWNFSTGAPAQPLHTDFMAYRLFSMARGYSLAVSVATRCIGLEDAPMRIVPWSDRRGHSYPDMLLESPDMAKFVTVHPGDMLIRDVRCPHAGSYHSGTNSRILPGLQVFSSACNGCRSRCKRYEFILKDTSTSESVDMMSHVQ